MFGVEESNVNRKMKGMLMNEISYVNPCFEGINRPNNNVGFVNSCDFGYAAEGSSSSSSRSPLTFMHPFNSTMHQGTQIPCFRGIESELAKNPNVDSLFDVPYEVGLCKNLQGIRVGDEHNFCINNSRFPADPDGLVIRYSDPLSIGFGGFDKYVFSHYFGRFSGEFSARDSIGPFAFPNISNAIGSGEQIDYDCNLMETNVQGSGYIDPGVQFQMQNVTNGTHVRPGFSNRLYRTPQYGGFGNESLSSSQSADPSTVFGSLYEIERMQQNHGLFQCDKAFFHASVSSVPKADEVNPFSCERSFTVDTICSTCAVGTKCKPSKGSKKKSKNEIMMKRPQEEEVVLDSHLKSGSLEPLHYHSMLGNINGNFLLMHTSLADLKGYIHLIAKHQLGCRFLQRIFDEGSPEDVKEIYKEVIDHIVELMTDPFGNYLIQKMLESCSEEQKLQIVLRVTKRRGELVNICLSTHGTRVVQKLIESIKSNQQISLVMIALKPGLVDLIKDPNGNHVVQSCLQWLNDEQNKFIFDAAAKFCIDIACDRHGCCVLNRCIACSSGVRREKLVLSISGHGLLLAQDAFGNYVIQQIIELKIPCAIATLLPLFEDHYVHLSMQKFSSHVVEKCLRCVKDSHSRIIKELLSVHHFDQLLQDRFANYVVQAALEVTKGSPSLHSVLVKAIRPYQSLRSSPYCKKIFTSDVWKQ